jgi:Fe-Mn family superoxide dismutase
MHHELPALPYGYNALQPILSEETLQYHHDAHHGTYVKTLNKLIEGRADFENLTLEEIIKREQPGALFNNAAQAWNHAFYWNCLTPDAQKAKMDSELESALVESFGSVEAFKNQFQTAATKQFGSGWAWLVKERDGKLAIETTTNAETPLQQGKCCLLTCDVWEHAYYIDYRNLRPKYLEAFWEVVNWQFVGEQFSKAA